MHTDVIETQSRLNAAGIVPAHLVVCKVHHDLHPHVRLDPTRVGVVVRVHPQLHTVRNNGLIQRKLHIQVELPKHPFRIGRRRPSHHKGVGRVRGCNHIGPIREIVVECDLALRLKCQTQSNKRRQTRGKNSHVTKIRGQSGKVPCSTSRTNAVTPPKKASASSHSAK